MEQEKHLRHYWQMFLTRKHFFIWPAVAITVISGLVALLLPPIFESKSTILIEEQQIPPDFVKSTVTGFADQRIQSLNQQILSRTRLLEIIRQFDLYRDMKKNYTQEEIIETMRRDISVDLIGAEVGVGGQRKRQAGGQGGVTIAFTVTYLGKQPDTVQKIAGRLASLYLEENLKIREMQAKTTTKFLETELKELQERIKNIGQQITEFKAKHGEILPELQQFNRSQVERLETERKQLSMQIQNVEDRKIYLEGQLASIDPSNPEKGASPQTRLQQLEVLLCDLQSRYSSGHPDISKVQREMAKLKKLAGTQGGTSSARREKLAQLKTDLAQIQGRYSDEHPEVIKLKKEIAELEKTPDQAQASTSETKTGNPAYISLQSNIQLAANDIQALKRQQADLEEKLKTYRKRLEESPKVEQEYAALTRDYQNTHAKHMEVMNKILEARISEGMEESQKAEKFTIIDPASYPEKPVSPKRGFIFLAGVILGLGVGLGMVALAEHMDTSVKSAEELAWLTGLPVLGRIALIITAEDRAREKYRQRLIWSLIGLCFITALIIFHFFVKDLWILTARIGQLAGKYL